MCLETATSIHVAAPTTLPHPGQQMGVGGRVVGRWGAWARRAGGMSPTWLALALSCSDRLLLGENTMFVR